jgi:hypothetical protein
MSSRLSESDKRVILVVGSNLIGALCGFILALGWGKNFKPRTFQEAQLGIFHRIPLPSDISGRDINFEIQMPGADDFARVYVNGYLALSTEDMSNIVQFREGPEGEERKRAASFVEQYAVRRNHPHSAERVGRTGYLKASRNFVVLEIENSTQGYCGGGIRLFVNGEELTGVPISVPAGSEEIGALRGVTSGEVTDVANALCSRRIIEFDLGNDAEPVQKFKDAFKDALNLVQ